ncbi:MAG: S9 family peptidase [Alphaproteobacteria bacterium]|nr:S9 family peptidase [Alphaproteobacteria bacterium]
MQTSRRTITLCGATSALALASGLAGAPSHAVAAQRGFQLDDVARIVALQDPQISPDGRYVAVIVARPNVKTDKPDAEIDILDTKSGAVRVFTQDRSGLASPRWSPDGRRLAFIAEAEAPPEPKSGAANSSPGNSSPDGAKPFGKAQIFVAPMDGGDPQRITAAAKAVSAFAWSPDGASIAYIAAEPDPKLEDPHDDAFEVTDNNFLVRKPETSSQLWVVPAAGGEARELTHGPTSLDTDQGDGAAPTYAPDGATIAVTRFPGPWFGPAFRSTVVSVPTSGGEARSLAPDRGSRELKFAPSGSLAAYLRPRGGDQNNGDAVYVLSGGKSKDATAALARHVNAFAWLPDGRTLLLHGEDGTRSYFWVQPVSGDAQRLDLGEVQPRTFSVARNGAVAFVGVTPTHPAELYVLDRPGAAPRRMTHLNDFIDQIALGRREGVDWRGPGGFAEDGVLTYPADDKIGAHYPLALVIHGGPAAGSTTAFDPLPALLASKGFLVFEPNYRGSTNLGDAYQHAIFRDTGPGPGADVMAGLAKVESLGVVDPARIVVSGWSYGGYMTTWLTGHYGGWRAAVAGAPLTDWMLDYTIAFYQEGDVYMFGDTPWRPSGKRNLWRDQSPIASAAHVTAPTLLMGDVGDPNVPLVNAYEWYHALRDHGVAVKFVAYPADTHFPHDIVRTLDVYRRWTDWLVTHDR